MGREYSDEEAVELARQVRTSRAAPRGPRTGVVWAWFQGLGLAGVIGSLSFLTLGSLRWLGPMAPVFGGGSILLVVGYVGAIRSRRRFKRRVLERGGLVCPNCHYDLSEVEAAEGVTFCPECREPYRRSELRRLWEGWSPGIQWLE